MRVLRFSITALILLLAAAAVSGQSLKLLSYNTLHGFDNNTENKTKYVNWLTSFNPDIVTYQEMIGYSAADLRAFAARYGHKYSVIMNKEAGVDVTHPLAITSRYPITNVKMVLDSMWHGYLLAKIKGINILVTHLAPFTLEDRQKDISTIIAATTRLNVNEAVVVAGDFNALARIDSANYGKDLLASLKRLDGRLEPKSGTPIVKSRIIYRHNLNKGQIDYSVTDSMVNAGFIDAFKQLHPTFKNTVPVKSNYKNEGDEGLRRVDYVWVNEVLLKRLVSADIIQNDITDVISDHYPVFVEFKLK